jgi:signal transduction histidine kinase
LVRFSLKKAVGRIEMTIQDNGKGFLLEGLHSVGSSERGMGLTSMRERTQLSGGTFEIQSTLGKGTIIKASWPI